MKVRHFLIAMWGASAGVTAFAMPALQHEVEYDPSQVAWASRDGSSTVQGIMTWRWGGRHWPCASVDLIPQSAYADETFLRVYGNNEGARIKPTKMRGYFRSHDPRYDRDKRLARCDRQGAFAFKAVPAGTYYLTGTFSGSLQTVNMGIRRNVAQELVWRRVNVTDGQTTEIDLKDR